MAARSIPVAATKAPAQLITGALWNAGPKALGDYLLNPPIFRGRQSTTQGVTTASYTAMALDVTDVDSDTGHSNVTNNTRYTCQIPGWYWAEGYVALSNSGASSRFLAAIAKNGTWVTGSEQFLLRQTDLQACNAMAIVQLAVGDYVEVWGYQSSGSTVSTFDGSDLTPCLNVFWISK